MVNTSQLKQTRETKQSMLKEIVRVATNIMILQKGRLDRVDFRVLKEILRKLNDCENRALPVPTGRDKIVSSKRDMDIGGDGKDDY